MAMKKSAQEVVAKALWADGNNRIGHRPWGTVGNAYMAEAGHALAALKASGFDVTESEKPTVWWITTDFFRLGGRVFMGPFESQELALAVRTYVEKIEPRTFAVDSSKAEAKG